MEQEMIVWMLFATAAGYIGWRFWKTFDKKTKGGCAKGCGCETDQKMKINNIS
jgi:hypothetical protein